MTSNLTIMSPGGHRVVLKVNNNSPLCLALEEGCNQFELESSWFGLRHLNRSLNVSATFRQSGVPNNATLELYKLEKERVPASVRIALQLQDGSRFMGAHPSSDSLWEVVSTAEKEGGFVIPLCYPGGVPARVPCLEYSKTKVIGEGELRNKALKSLGIFAGSVIIRYSTVESEHIPETISEEVTVLRGYHRPALVPDQTDHPPAELPSTPPFPIHQMNVLGQGVSETDPALSELLHTPWSFDLQLEEERRREEERRKPKQLFRNPEGWSHDKSPFGNINLGAILPQMHIPFVPPEEDYIAQFNSLRADKTGIPLEPDEDYNPPIVALPPSPPIAAIAYTSPIKRVYEEACPRGTCVFHLDKNEYSDVRPAELDDGFFLPTLNEAVKRQNELEKENSQLYDSPLTLQSYKKIREVPNLEKYDKTVIRVVLPNRLVLQGVFRSGEPVKALVNFIRDCLVDPKLKFHLFTTPPKRVIKNGRVTFKEANLIPASNVLLALDETAEGLLVKEDLLDQVATQLEADVKSSKERGTLNLSTGTSDTNTASALMANAPVPSHPGMQKSRKQGDGGGSAGSGKPKWLKLGK